MVTKIPKPGSPAEAELALQLRAMKALNFNREYRFDEIRKWRFDFAWPELLFAVEIEGITYDHGRHQRKDGFEKDLEKYQAAMLQGWTVYRCSPMMVVRGAAINTILSMLQTLLERNTNEKAGLNQ